MSFILDALKKSEHARQRQAGPALFEVKVVQPRRTLPIWAFVIAILILINGMTLGWILLGRGRGEPQARPQLPAPDGPAAANRATRSLAPGAPQPASAARAPAPTLSATSTAPAVPGPSPLGSPVPASSSALQQNSASASQPDVANPPNPADFEPAVQPAPSAAPSTGPSAAAQTSGSLPLYAQIAAEPGSTLPRLHLDLHVYGPDPSKRFVMINMQKLHQGDTLPDGVSVVKIRPDGVVLSYQGREFLLPR